MRDTLRSDCTVVRRTVEEEEHASMNSTAFGSGHAYPIYAAERRITFPTYVDAPDRACVHNSGLSTHTPETHKGCVLNRSYVRSGWSDQST